MKAFPELKDLFLCCVNTINVIELQLKICSERLYASEMLQPALQGPQYNEAHLKHFHTNACSTRNKQELEALAQSQSLMSVS